MLDEEQPSKRQQQGWRSRVENHKNYQSILIGLVLLPELYWYINVSTMYL